MISVSIALQTQFYDIDPMNVVWHGNYPRFLEQARSALLAHIGYNYVEMHETGFYWPIVDMRIKYVASLRFPQDFMVTAALIEYENRLVIDYRISDATGTVVTKATTTQVAVSIDRGEMQLISPSIFRERVQACLSQNSSSAS